MTRGRLVVHAHFYQPLRADPFTGIIPREPSAAPYHDWDERVNAECYRPNAERRNLDRLSYDVGPTLADLARTGRSGNIPAIYRGGPSDAGRRRSRQRDGAGVPPHDPAAGFARRQANGDPLGDPRLRGSLRPPAGRHVAAGDGRRLADPAGCSPSTPSATRSSPPGSLRTPRSTPGARTASISAAVGRSPSSSTTGRCRVRSRSTRLRPRTRTRSSATASSHASGCPPPSRRRCAARLRCRAQAVGPRAGRTQRRPRQRTARPLS